MFIQCYDHGNETHIFCCGLVISSIQIAVIRLYVELKIFKIRINKSVNQSVSCTSPNYSNNSSEQNGLKFIKISMSHSKLMTDK